MSIISQVIKKVAPFGLYRLARFLTRSEPKILMFHRFSSTEQAGKVCTDVFERQLKYVKKHFHSATVADIGNAIFESNNLKPNTISLTIDDGYQDFYHYAYPLLKKYQIPATLYVTTGFIDNDNWLWPDKILWLINNAPEKRAEFQFDSINLLGGNVDDDQKKKDWGTLNRYLLSVDNDKKERCIAQLAQNFALTIPKKAPQQYAPCTIEQLKEMQENGIEIGGHTVNHPSLGRVSNAIAKQEIIECEHWLNEKLGVKSRSFCFPNGTECDYTNDVISILEHSTQFNCCVTAFADELGAKYRFEIRRHTGSPEMFQFYKSLTGFELLGNKLRAFIK